MLEVGRQPRLKAADADLSWQRSTEALSCYRGIWDEGVGLPESSLLEQLTQLERKNRCYFMAYQPGMLLSAAEKLQETRLTQTRELQKLRYAAYSIAISLLAILTKLLLGSS